jgi:hypothetical protein
MKDQRAARNFMFGRKALVALACIAAGLVPALWDCFRPFMRAGQVRRPRPQRRTTTLQEHGRARCTCPLRATVLLSTCAL